MEPTWQNYPPLLQTSARFIISLSFQWTHRCIEYGSVVVPDCAASRLFKFRADFKCFVDFVCLFENSFREGRGCFSVQLRLLAAREKKITSKWGGQENIGQSSVLPAPNHDAPSSLSPGHLNTKGISLAVISSPWVTGAVPLALWRKEKIEI